MTPPSAEATPPSPATGNQGATPGQAAGNEGVMPSERAPTEAMPPSEQAGGGGGGMQPSAPGAEGPGMEGGTETPACPATATLQAGDTTMTVSVEGVQRTFLVHAPPGYDSTTAVPIVLDFHGLGGNSNQQKNLSNWDELADQEGFISVYPQGLNNAWNAGLCCGNGGSDVPFVRAIIAALATDACIDQRRVFASGCSNGGGMSYKLACEASDIIAAVAPVDFDCVDGAGCGNCNPGRPVTVVQFRGTNDQLVPYDGNGPFAGAQNNLATWGEINMCSGSPGPLQQSAGCESFPMCGAGAQTVLCTVQNGTHCGSYGSFDIPEVAWQVLESQALP